MNGYVFVSLEELKLLVKQTSQTQRVKGKTFEDSRCNAKSGLPGGAITVSAPCRCLRRE